MCGRYTITRPAEQLAARFAAQPLAEELQANPNASPTQDLPVVVCEDGARELALLRWGLVPHWAKDPAIGSKMINARAETVAEKASFREPLRKRRCLVPADGFYEWQATPRGKQPMRFWVADQELFALAGLWTSWRASDGGWLRTFTILTTEPNALVAPVHNRMPVLLRPEDEARWLDVATPAATLQDLFTPFPADLMRVEPVAGRLGR